MTQHVETSCPWPRGPLPAFSAPARYWLLVNDQMIEAVHARPIVGVLFTGQGVGLGDGQVALELVELTAPDRYPPGTVMDVAFRTYRAGGRDAIHVDSRRVVGTLGPPA